jgi:hypothetical protein
MAEVLMIQEDAPMVPDTLTGRSAARCAGDGGDGADVLGHDSSRSPGGDPGHAVL